MVMKYGGMLYPVGRKGKMYNKMETASSHSI